MNLLLRPSVSGPDASEATRVDLEMQCKVHSKATNALEAFSCN